MASAYFVAQQELELAQDTHPGKPEAELVPGPQHCHHDVIAQ
jgi:hypothetical protein